jgi:hypothetical protein
MSPRLGGQEINKTSEEFLLELRCIHERMEAMETTQTRELDIGDVSESEDKIPREEKEVMLGRDTTKEKLLRLVTKVGAKQNMEVPMYKCNLNMEEFIDWINSMDKYFYYE